MGKRENYAPGTFCWVDLATTDPAGAKAFYTGLFGWEAEDVPAGEAGTYTVLRSSGDEVCGLYEMDAERRDQGVPPQWLSHVSVEDADAVASRARELGGTVYGEVVDVGEHGRFAMVQDPSGAELFGWEMEPQEDDGRLAYVVIKNAGRSNGGIMPMTEQHGDTPPFWLAYFTVPSCDAAVAKVRELGGEVLAGPLDLGAGRIAVASDPQGAVFALFEGETDD